MVTGFLWWSTRKLVKGAEDTAIRQLRAYVSINIGHFSIEAAKNYLRIEYLIKNMGQTPAEKLSVFSVYRVGY